MITLEQIRLLEGKITKAIDLIRILKEENATLRKGLDSAQRRMKELESLVDGFKTDQKEIESVIVRTLKNLDELEESGIGQNPPPPRAPGSEQAATSTGKHPQPVAASTGAATQIASPSSSPVARVPSVAVEKQSDDLGKPSEKTADQESKKGELDIF